MTSSAGIAGEILLCYGRVGVLVRFYGMNSVTIGAHRRKLISARDRLPVDAGAERVLDIGMALATSGGDAEPGDERLGVVWRQYGM